MLEIATIALVLVHRVKSKNTTPIKLMVSNNVSNLSPPFNLFYIISIALRGDKIKE